MVKPENLEEQLAHMRSFGEIIDNYVTNIGLDKLRTLLKVDGWTGVQQLHHLADAQNMAYYRIKLMVSNDNPTLIPFDQNLWMTYNDSVTDDPLDSINLIKGTYNRWADLLEGLSDEQWERKAAHPEAGEVSVKGLFEFYIDHGRNHLNQLEILL